jgi:hypothetical protein
VTGDAPGPRLPQAVLARIAELETTDDGTPLSQLGLSVPDKIALSDAQIRRNIAYAIMCLFAIVNIATLWFIYFLFEADQRDLAARLTDASGRIINAHVIITLLGATTVQLGTVMVIMARYVFKAPVDEAD